MKENKFNHFILSITVLRKNCGNASRDLYIYCADDQNIRFFLCDK